jgi:hypothetical protein
MSFVDVDCHPVAMAPELGELENVGVGDGVGVGSPASEQSSADSASFQQTKPE